MLDRLPVEILVHLVTQFLAPLDCRHNREWPKWWQHTLSTVCRTWQRRLTQDVEFWNRMATWHGLTLSSRRQRGIRNAQEAFWERWRTRRQAWRLQQEAFISSLHRRLQGSDCAAYIRAKFPKDYIQTHESLPRDTVNFAVSSMEHRTLLHLACWHGRVRTVRLLLEDYEADAFVVDDNGASPLLIAAWSGHDKVVRVLLAHITAQVTRRDGLLEHLHQRGIPPLTSSCGGKGPKTPLKWAQRKFFPAIVRMLENAGATR